MSGELDLEVILEGEQEKPDGDENNHTQVSKTINLNFWFNTIFYALATQYSV